MLSRFAPILFFPYLLITMALAQGTYTQIDVPGASVTEATGINKAGEIVGTYVDVAGGHGFLLRNGSFITIDYPGVQYSYAERINDQDQIIGLAEPLGYLYDLQTQVFTPISCPGATFTYPLGINNSGSIAGYFMDSAFNTVGFEMTNSASSCTTINPPAATSASPQGISDRGAIVGSTYVRWKAANFNFLFANSKYGVISLPNAPGAQVFGINPQGTAVVGTYDALSGLTGFIYQNRVLQ